MIEGSRNIMAEKAATKKRIALITYDKIGTKMAGPGIRYFELAKELSKHYRVTLFSPYKSDIKNNDFKIELMNSGKPGLGLSAKIRNFDVVLSQSLPPYLLSKIRKLGLKYIADLYDPLLIEVLEYTKGDKPALRQNTYNFNFYTVVLQLASANHLLCASQKQFDYYVGILSGRKILGPDFYDSSANLKKFISITPFGLRAEAPKANQPDEIYQKFPGINKGDKIVYWGGGVWNWFDPLTPIKAIEMLSKKRSDIKLFFLGVKHPNPKVKAMSVATKACEYAKEKNLLDKFVFFNFDWVPYEERSNYLLESSVGISAHFDNVETRFSFRTRILDYLWADLPMVLTRGDAFADLCSQKNLGITVNFEDEKETAAAIEKLVDDKQLRTEVIKNITEIKKEFTWPKIAAKIADIIDGDLFIKRKINPLKFFSLSFDFYLSGLKKKISK